MKNGSCFYMMIEEIYITSVNSFYWWHGNHEKMLIFLQEYFRIWLYKLWLSLLILKCQWY